MVLNVKLLPVNEVLKFREEVDIQLDVPINLFLDKSFREHIERSREIQAAPPVEMAEPARAAESVAEPPPAAASQTPPPPPEGASIMLSLDEIAEEGIAAPEPVIEAAPPLSPAEHVEEPVAEIIVEHVAESAAASDAPLAVEAAPQQAPEISFLSPAPQFEPTAEALAPIIEAEAAQDLPYLFSGSGSTETSLRLTRGIATGGASHAPAAGASGEPASGDVEMLKNYLTMREQDIAVLKVTLNYTREEIQKSEDAIRAHMQENDELRHRVDALQSKVDAFERERAVAGQSMESEIDRARGELRAKSDRIRVLEEKLKDSHDQYEKLKERVRIDIRKIRVRERELESKLEILKRDSETLIVSRESKILELKRRIDVLEFNCETLLERAEAEKRNTLQALEREERARQALQGAMSILEGGAEEPGEGKEPGSEIKVA
ncbi:MAG: hypothetical protein HYW49_10705 [Deltaproteobacteria bacterium]|nr:hypothetical protein [Deltaproteobacteria bacterium]